MTTLTPTRQALHPNALNLNRLRFANNAESQGAKSSTGPDSGSSPQAASAETAKTQAQDTSNKDRSWGQFFVDKLSGFPLIGNFVKAGAAFFTAYSFLSGSGLMNKLLTAYPRLGNGLRIALAAGFALAVFFIPALQNEASEKQTAPKAATA